MVGDSPEDDVDGAKALGMRAFLVDREDRYADVEDRLPGPARSTRGARAQRQTALARTAEPEAPDLLVDDVERGRRRGPGASSGRSTGRSRRGRASRTRPRSRNCGSPMRSPCGVRHPGGLHIVKRAAARPRRNVTPAPCGSNFLRLKYQVSARQSRQTPYRVPQAERTCPRVAPRARPPRVRPGTTSPSRGGAPAADGATSSARPAVSARPSRTIRSRRTSGARGSPADGRARAARRSARAARRRCSRTAARAGAGPRWPGARGRRFPPGRGSRRGSVRGSRRDSGRCSRPRSLARRRGRPGSYCLQFEWNTGRRGLPGTYPGTSAQWSARQKPDFRSAMTRE